MAKKKTETTIESVLEKVAEVREAAPSSFMTASREILKVEFAIHTNHSSAVLDRADPSKFDILEEDDFVFLICKRSKHLIKIPWSNVTAVHYKPA